jgi:hypothetical protein
MVRQLPRCTRTTDSAYIVIKAVDLRPEDRVALKQIIRAHPDVHRAADGGTARCAPYLDVMVGMRAHPLRRGQVWSRCAMARPAPAAGECQRFRRVIGTGERERYSPGRSRHEGTGVG